MTMVEEAARNRLGRGLAALIGDVGGEATVIDRPRASRRLPIESLRPNPRNPRRAFDPSDLDDLASSVVDRLRPEDGAWPPRARYRGSR